MKKVARWTGLEPATPGVTGRYSNQLSYHRKAIRARPNVSRYYGSMTAASSALGPNFCPKAPFLRRPCAGVVSDLVRE